MASPLNAVICALVATGLWSVLGYALLRRALPRAVAIGMAPVMGWAVHSAVTLPLFTLVGFSPAAVMGVAALCVIAALLSFRLATPNAIEHTATIPAWAFAAAALLALVPAVAILMSAYALSTAEAAVISGLFGTPPIAIEVRAEPITAFDQHDPSRLRFGQLEFRGGLTLTSSYREFGGLSAIRIAPDGANFISLSDHGRWFKGRLTYEGARPVGIADAVMAPILGPDGQALAAHGWHDTESIADDGDTLYVGIERVSQIV